jgi:hypothetical protein
LLSQRSNTTQAEHGRGTTAFTSGTLSLQYRVPVERKGWEEESVGEKINANLVIIWPGCVIGAVTRVGEEESDEGLPTWQEEVGLLKASMPTRVGTLKLLPDNNEQQPLHFAESEGNIYGGEGWVQKIAEPGALGMSSHLVFLTAL